VIWTRVAPPTPIRRVAVTWEVAADPSFRRVVRRGRVDATAASDHTVKVLVQGLDPDRWYHYRFRTA
jgi:alkaline phosphatase D